MASLKECPKCGQKFRKQSSFNRHYKRFHSKKANKFTVPASLK